MENTDVTPGKRPVSFLEEMGDRRNIVLLALTGAGILVFGLLLVGALRESGSNLLTAIRQIAVGFTRIETGAAVESLERTLAIRPANELQPAFQLVWVCLLSLGLWGWMLVERSFKNANPTIEICLRRAGVIGLGLVLYLIAGFDLSYPGKFTAGGALPVPGFGAAWSSSRSNLLLQALTPCVVLTAIAGYAICGVRTRFLLTLATLVSLILFPVFASWLWGQGWLAQIKISLPTTYPRDLAGAGVIHVLCGAVGIAVLAGSRWSAHEALPREKMRPERRGSAILGLILVQFAFIALLGGSVMEPNGPLIAGVILQGAIAAAAGAIVTGLAQIRIQIRPLPHILLFGTMGGWVIVSGGAGGFELWQAAVLGAVAGVLVMTGLALLDTLEMRDPFALVPIHFLCGSAGFMAASWSWWTPNIILQLVALLAIMAPTLIIGIALVWIFVRNNRLSKRDPKMPVDSLRE